MSKFSKFLLASLACSRQACLPVDKESHPQALSSPERKILIGFGHVAPRFRVLADKINMQARLFSWKYVLCTMSSGPQKFPSCP